MYHAAWQSNILFLWNPEWKSSSIILWNKELKWTSNPGRKNIFFLFYLFFMFTSIFILNHQKGNLISRGDILGIRGVKRLEQFERGQSLSGDIQSYNLPVNLPGRIYLILHKKHLKNSSASMILLFIYCRHFTLQIFMSAPCYVSLCNNCHTL